MVRFTSPRVIVVALASIVLGLYFLPIDYLTACGPKPREVTVTSATETAARIEIFWQNKNALPENLSELPTRPGYANNIRDGWGRELIYEVKPDGIVVLASLGRDGKPGGTGNDADYSTSYRAVANQLQRIAEQGGL